MSARAALTAVSRYVCPAATWVRFFFFFFPRTVHLGIPLLELNIDWYRGRIYVTKRNRIRRRRYRTAARGKLTVLIFHVHFRGRAAYYSMKFHNAQIIRKGRRSSRRLGPARTGVLLSRNINTKKLHYAHR